MDPSSGGVHPADTCDMKRSMWLLALVLLTVLIVPLAQPASARYGDPIVGLGVKSDGTWSPRKVFVDADRTHRKVFEFSAWTRWWRQQQLVFHASPGSPAFEARYFVLRADGWKPITQEITSAAGFAAGRCDACKRKLKLVVNVSAPVGSEGRFRMTAGAPGGKSDWAIGIVRVV